MILSPLSEGRSKMEAGVEVEVASVQPISVHLDQGTRNARLVGAVAL